MSKRGGLDPADRDYRRKLGKVIVQMRWLRGRMSQAELAERIGRSEAAVSRWEGGKASPAAHDLRRMADVLDCPPELLIYPPAEPVSPVAEWLEARVSAGVAKGLAGPGSARATGTGG